jgi:hypothetical protein
VITKGSSDVKMWINNKVIGVTRCLPLIKHNGMKHVPFTHEMCHPKTVFNCFSKQTCLTTGLSTKFRGQANHLVGSSAIPEIYFATSRGLVVVSNHGGNEWARGKAYICIYIYVYICIYIYTLWMDANMVHLPTPDGWPQPQQKVACGHWTHPSNGP